MLLAAGFATLRGPLSLCAKDRGWMNCSVDRPNLRRSSACAALALAASAGCARAVDDKLSLGLAAARSRGRRRPRPTTRSSAANDPKAIALRKANGEEPETPEAALTGVLDELQEIGAIDPAAQQQLMADLKAAKPEHYSLIVEQFRAALAYRQQLAEREAARRQPTGVEVSRSGRDG